MLIAGDQVPVIPLVDVVGRAGMKSPAQYGPKFPNIGVVLGKMEMVRNTCEAH